MRRPTAKHPARAPPRRATQAPEVGRPSGSLRLASRGIRPGKQPPPPADVVRNPPTPERPAGGFLIVAANLGHTIRAARQPQDGWHEAANVLRAEASEAAIWQANVRPGDCSGTCAD